ncbi:MAG: RDD family protein [bacterium]|nr:RDD family protein [bacterium]
MQEARPDAEVLGIDNVPLELPIAGLGNRVLAAFLDYFLLTIVVALLSVALFAVAAVLELGVWALVAWLVLSFLLTWGLFAGVEISMDGQTPGKRVLELRVVSEYGSAATMSSLVVRNLLRIVDMWVGIVFMAADPKARRLGDRLAGTVVVHERKPSTRLILGRTPASWGTREVAVVEGYVDRADLLEPDRARLLANRILLWVARDEPTMLDEDNPDLDPVVRVRLAFRVESL